MARIAATIKETFASEYQELSEKQKSDYVENSLVLYSECQVALVDYATKRNLAIETLVTIEETMRENIIIESLYANPDDPQKVIGIARTKISKAVKIMLDTSSDPFEIITFISQNSGTTALKTETENLLKYYRYYVKYQHVEMLPEYENE